MKVALKAYFVTIAVLSSVNLKIFEFENLCHFLNISNDSKQPPPLHLRKKYLSILCVINFSWCS